jgi:hypothetical protein
MIIMQEIIGMLTGRVLLVLGGRDPGGAHMTIWVPGVPDMTLRDLGGADMTVWGSGGTHMTIWNPGGAHMTLRDTTVPRMKSE